MATDVEVEVTDRAIISALNTPGGAVFEWRDETALAVITRAIALAEVGNKLNDMHRKSHQPGHYKSQFGWDRVGSNGHRVRATVFNGAEYADIVEFGRNDSHGYERFSWTRWLGDIRSVTRGTRGREGRHTLLRAVNGVMPEATGGSYTMLTP